MKNNEFQQLAPEALKARIQEMKAEYYDVRSQVASGKQKNTAILKGLRHQIAQALTERNSKPDVA